MVPDGASLEASTLPRTISAKVKMLVQQRRKIGILPTENTKQNLYNRLF